MLQEVLDAATSYFSHSDGVAVRKGKLVFVSKVQKELFLLDLDHFTDTAISTSTASLPGGGEFDSQPDHTYKVGL